MSHYIDLQREGEAHQRSLGEEAKRRQFKVLQKVGLRVQLRGVKLARTAHCGMKSSPSVTEKLQLRQHKGESPKGGVGAIRARCGGKNDQFL